MDMETLNKAKKELASIKPKENMALIRFSWSINIVLPYKDAVTVIAALTHAEQLEDPHSSSKRIKPVESDKITLTIMSPEEYQIYKLAALLNVPFDEIKEAMVPAA